MKRQKRGKCKLWRSFTNIFKRRKSADATEAPEEPFADVPNTFPPSKTTEEEKISPMKPDDISNAGIPKKQPVSPKKHKPLPKPVGQTFAGDLDAVGRGHGLMNSSFAKDRLKIKPKTRVPAKYNQKQSFESSFEDIATVHTESQDESQNSKDDNSAVILACGSGELSSSSDNTAERGAKVALLPKKPLPEAPHKKQPKAEETVEPVAEFRRVSSKKKTLSGKSDDAKKFQSNSKSVEPEETVNLSISDGHRSRAGSETKAAKGGSSVKVTELNTGALRPPETKPKAKLTGGGGNDSNIRHSVSMKEVKRSMEKDASWSGVDISIAGGKSKASAVESSKLSSSAKERKVASKAGSLSVESKPEAEETVSSTLENKSKAGKHEAGLPPQGSFRKLLKTEKAAKGEKAEANSEAKMDEENGLKRSLRRESKSKAEGKRVESVHAVLPAENNFKRDSSRRSSARKSGQWNQESHDVLSGKNSAEDDLKKTAESKNETQKTLDPMESSMSISKPNTDLQEGKELLAGKASGEAEKSLERSSNDLQVNALQEKGSNIIEVHSVADIQTSELVSVLDSREMLNGKKGKEDGKKEKKSDSQFKRNNSSQKSEFGTPSVPAKVVQKGKDMRNDIQSAAAATETEVRSKLPAVENVASDDVQKRMSKISISDEGGTKEFNKVLQKVHNKPSNANESALDSVETSPDNATKTENKNDAISSATEKSNSKPAKVVPIPPKANRFDSSRNDLGSSVKLTSGDSKNAPSASLSSNRSNHSRTPSVTSGEGKPQPEIVETEKSKGDVVTSSSSSSVKTKGPPPVVNRSGKVKAAESAKEPDNAWMERAKRMSKDFSDKMLQKVEIKTDDEKPDDGEAKSDDNFERGGTRSSVRDMVQKLQKPNQAS